MRTRNCHDYIPVICMHEMLMGNGLIIIMSDGNVSSLLQPMMSEGNNCADQEANATYPGYIRVLA